jgi:hypothetical protein
VRAPKSGGVYAIAGAIGYVKIGKAKNIAHRIDELQTGHPVRLRLLAVLSRDPAHERVLHERWSHLRSEGEWFKRDTELNHFIADRQERPGVAIDVALREHDERFGRPPEMPIDQYARRLLPLSPRLLDGFAWIAQQRESLAGSDFTPGINRGLREMSARLRWPALTRADTRHDALFDLADAVVRLTKVYRTEPLPSPARAEAP